MLRDDPTPSLDLESADEFENLLAASVHYHMATGPHTGCKALTLRTVAPNPLASSPCIAQLSGFSPRKDMGTLPSAPTRAGVDSRSTQARLPGGRS